MRRREFISLLGSAAAAWPLGVHAQQAAVPVIGFLSGVSPGPFAQRLAAFRQGLHETGQNATIEYRWAEGQYDRLPALANDLVGRPVVVIVAYTDGTRGQGGNDDHSHCFPQRRRSSQAWSG
jgi:putative ABC transport system substrate-binding protein